MTHYFHENIDPHQRWQFTQIEVARDFIPYYQLLTGGRNQRFLLGSHDHTLYWGQVSQDHYNVNFLRQNQPWQRPHMPIRPMTSADIEAFKQANPPNPARYWATFFAQQLLKSPASFLHQGQWRIAPAFDNESTDKGFTHLNDNRKIPSPEWYWSCLWSECDYDFDYQNRLLTIIDWDNNTQNPLPLKPPPTADDGRVKWWRKKIRENACPPLLLWWQSNLLSHIVIDGHSRWLAHQLENSKPDILVISAFKTTDYKTLDNLNNSEKRLHILQSLKHYVNNTEHSPKSVSMDKINEILLLAYPDTTYHEAITVGKPVADLDERWEREISLLMKTMSDPTHQKELENLLLRHDCAQPFSKY